MTLGAGCRLGPYEIQSALGAGGMGEVYRARDTRLDRTVALKVLSPRLIGDPASRERFSREARVVSRLSHPNICVLHDVGREPLTGCRDGAAPDADGHDFLVMEYLEGETLAARLRRAPMRVAEALDLAIEIAAALDAAHRAGVVHRDLKPANVMLVPGAGPSAARVKLLDFGLSRNASVAAIAGVPASTTTAMPIDGAITAEGTVLGTVQYMAPEQIEGHPVDARADIFAFGAVLHEMLTGRPAFDGRSAAGILGSVLKDTPPPIRTIVVDAPVVLEDLVAACLEKSPAERLQSSHDLVIQLRSIRKHLADGVASRGQVPSRRWPAAMLAAVAAAGALAGAGLVALSTSDAGDAATTPIELTVAPPDDSLVLSFALSPDGRHLVFATASDGVPKLWLRSIDRAEAVTLSGTNDATLPFWSPDSRSIGFFAGGKLKRIPVAGGTPVVLCDAPAGHGGSWSSEDVIVFAPVLDGPLQRVPASGGTPAPVTTLPAGATAHRWPWFLPDGRSFIYSQFTDAGSSLLVGSIGSAETTTIGSIPSSAMFADGHLFFARDGGLMAQRFDPDRLALSGAPFAVASPVGVYWNLQPFFSVSARGAISYRPSTRAFFRSRLTWLDRVGAAVGTIGDAASYANFDLSQDGSRLVVSMFSGSPGNNDIWVFDLARGGPPLRLTTDGANEFDPSVSPDNGRVVFVSNRLGPFNLFVRPLTGEGSDEVIVRSPANQSSPVWSPLGGLVVFHQSDANGTDLWTFSPDSGRASPFLQTPFNERHGSFSPDGRWVAYDSDALGRREVFIRAFPPTSAPALRVSHSGGVVPRWRGDGKELYFVGLDGMMWAAAVDPARTRAEAAVPLFQTHIDQLENNGRQYAVSPDGSRFLVSVPVRRAAATPVTVRLGWSSTAGQ